MPWSVAYIGGCVKVCTLGATLSCAGDEDIAEMGACDYIPGVC